MRPRQKDARRPELFRADFINDTAGPVAKLLKG
jgi:hypothetical protein